MVNNIVGEINSIRCTYKWIINNFCASCKNVGEVMKSPEFTTIDAGELRKWRLYLYPKGTKDEHKDYVSLFLCNLNDVDLTVNVWFRILDNEGSAAIDEYLPDHLFEHDTVGRVYGFPKFLKREFIEAKECNILCGGKLTIVCKITTITTPNAEHTDTVEETPPSTTASTSTTTSTTTPRPKVYPKVLMMQRKYIESKQLATDLEQMINDQEFSDIELTVEDKTLRAHKSILGKRSRVFAAMFRNNMSEKLENKVKIVDIRHEVLLEMLRYMYTGKVNLNGIETMTEELLIAADKYSLDGLKNMCGEILADGVDKDNALDRLKLAVQHRVEVLKDKVIDFVVERGSDIVNKPEFQQLPVDIVCEVCSAFAAEKKT